MLTMNGIRLAMRGLERYVPGKPISDLLREFPYLDSRRVVKLASNESPLGPSPLALKAARRALVQGHIYPEATSLQLRHRLGQLHDVSADEVIVTSGGDEGLRLIVETLIESGDRCVISQFAFSRFRQHARLMGADIVEVAAVDFAHDLASMARAALRNKAKIVFIANPNNPTGTISSHEELRDFFKILLNGSNEGHEAPWVVLDEAYCDFARDAYPEHYPMSLPQYLNFYSKLIVIRTFSKIGGLAGLRVAYAVASAELLSYAHRARLIFNVNSVAQAAALACLDDVKYRQRLLAMVRQGRQELFEKLPKFKFRISGPSAGNFIFAQAPQKNGKKLYQDLLAKGVIIRPLSDRGLESYVRITIGSPAQNRMLFRALGALKQGTRKTEVAV